MSDARWQDIDSDVASSVEHFSNAIRIAGLDLGG